MAERKDSRLHAIAHPKLIEDTTDMGFDRVWADIELRRNLYIGVAIDNQPQDLHLTT